MIKAVFFDWFNTLAVYHPPREMLQSQAIRENGYNVSPEQVLPALLIADKMLFAENANKPLRLRIEDEQTAFYTRYEETLLHEIGIDTSGNPSIALSIYNRARELYEDIGFALFDDVVPVLKKLSEQGYTTGLITNIDSDMTPVCESLGVLPYLNPIVTSGEAGASKPNPKIFNLALKKANVTASEAIHVGDQYDSDIVGAKRAGIKPILLDRFNHFTDITSCIRINTLEEVFSYL